MSHNIVSFISLRRLFSKGNYFIPSKSRNRRRNVSCPLSNSFSVI